MKINYEFTRTSPKQLFAQVRYFAAGRTDIYQNLRVTDFSRQGLEDAAKSRFGFVELEWTDMENQPDSFEETVTGSGYTKQVVSDPVPDFDVATQKLMETVVETEDEIRTTYVVALMSDTEKAERVAKWRKEVSVTPRQARLELAKRGLLANIDTIIAALPADQQDAVKIEWEYAVSVERGSVWVQQLGTALGLDDSGLDDLFLKAAEL